MPNHKNTVDLTDVDDLRRRFHYDPETGVVTRRISSYRWKAGTEVGTVLSNQGGRRVYKTRTGAVPLTHLIWLLVHGQKPEGEIDHINRNPSDDRLANLRDVTRAENMRNRRNWGEYPRGVSREHNRFRATLCRDGKTVYLGTYETVEEAERVYNEAREKYDAADKG